MGSLYELKGLPEKIWDKIRKLKTPELPRQFSNYKSDDLKTKKLIELFEGFIKQQRKTIYFETS